MHECYKQGQAEVASNSRNMVHQTWDPPFIQALKFIGLPNKMKFAKFFLTQYPVSVCFHRGCVNTKSTVSISKSVQAVRKLLGRLSYFSWDFPPAPPHIMTLRSCSCAAICDFSQVVTCLRNNDTGYVIK